MRPCWVILGLAVTGCALTDHTIVAPYTPLAGSNPLPATVEVSWGGLRVDPTLVDEQFFVEPGVGFWGADVTAVTLLQVTVPVAGGAGRKARPPQHGLFFAPSGSR